MGRVVLLLGKTQVAGFSELLALTVCWTLHGGFYTNEHFIQTSLSSPYGRMLVIFFIVMIKYPTKAT